MQYLCRAEPRARRTRPRTLRTRRSLPATHNTLVRLHRSARRRAAARARGRNGGRRGDWSTYSNYSTGRSTGCPAAAGTAGRVRPVGRVARKSSRATFVGRGRK